MPTSPASSNGSDWRPAASLQTLRLRARLLQQVREFFTSRGLLEVETPQLSAAAATDLHLESLVAQRPSGEVLGWLHTSPEFPMKRLLAAGTGDIWQLARVFRGAEYGRRHNPEFSLLEWYRVGWDVSDLMDEVDELLRMLSGPNQAPGKMRCMTYRDAFLEHAGFDPFTADIDAMTRILTGGGVDVPSDLGPDHRAALLDLALAVLVEPRLDPACPTFICDFPSTHAALARIRPGEPAVAERFELFYGGMELANGFHELTDADEQAARFEADLVARSQGGRVELPMDRRLLAALEHGMPDCSGVALGFDRLVMILAGETSLDRVLAFPWGRS